MADVSSQGAYPDGPQWELHKACHEGEVEDVLRVLRSRTANKDFVDRSAPNDLDNESQRGETPLIIACLRNKKDIVGLLLDEGADPTKCKQNGASPLFLSCQGNRHACLRILFRTKKILPNSPPKSTAPCSPLYIAAQRNAVECLAILIAEGAKLNVETQRGFTPLNVAAYLGHSLCVRHLLIAGAKVTGGTSATWPIYSAIENQNDECVKLLLEYGASMTENFISNQGRRFESPLFRAASKGSVRCLREMLRHSRLQNRPIDVNKVTDLQLQHGLVFEAVSSRSNACVRLLIDAGARPNQRRGADNASPLVVAASQGTADIVGTLLDAGANTDLKISPGGQTALYLASQNGHVECVRTLIEHGRANVNAVSITGASSLFIACQKGHTEIVCRLVAAGASVNQVRFKNTFCDIPLTIACHFGHKKTIGILLAHGGNVDHVVHQKSAKEIFQDRYPDDDFPRRTPMLITHQRVATLFSKTDRRGVLALMSVANRGDYAIPYHICFRVASFVNFGWFEMSTQSSIRKTLRWVLAIRKKIKCAASKASRAKTGQTALMRHINGRARGCRASISTAVAA